MLDAEKRILAGFPRLASTAIAPEVESLLNDHLADTHRQIKKIDAIFEAFEAVPLQRTCEITVRLMYEADILINTYEDSLAMDAAIIFSVLQIKHHEIASYGCLFAWAKLLENCRAATLLLEILEEEQEMVRQLTRLNEEAFDHNGMSLSLEVG